MKVKLTYTRVVTEEFEVDDDKVEIDDGHADEEYNSFSINDAGWEQIADQCPNFQKYGCWKYAGQIREMSACGIIMTDFDYDVRIRDW